MHHSAGCVIVFDLGLLVRGLGGVGRAGCLTRGVTCGCSALDAFGATMRRLFSMRWVAV